jgi:hypothetical protein
MDRSCPHHVVGGQCMDCLADHLAVEAAMLAQIRTWRRLPPDPPSRSKEEVDAQRSPGSACPHDDAADE